MALRLYNGFAVAESIDTKMRSDSHEESEAWGFRIPSDGRQPFLASYALYENRVEALQKLLEALERAQKTAHFFRSGDDANLNLACSNANWH